MITYIPRSKLEPHPDNPRKDLGDLTELAMSIRKQGLLQNLTVVPSPDSPDKYRIVIGHRRFNASVHAGLDELPCVIDEKMTYSEQIAVMMSENIQRNDLKVTEKVGGVQMMMDLGMGVSEIAGNTGISETSIRRYAKIGKLGRVDMAKAEQRGATLMQFAEISEIEDEELRQAALDTAGTEQYNQTMYKVRNWRLKKERMPLIVEKVSEFAVELKKEDYGRYVWLESIRYADVKWLETLANVKRKKGVSYGYMVRDYDVVIYEERQQQSNAKDEEKRRKAEKIRARINHESEIAVRFKEMRDAFMERLDVKGKEYEAQVFVLWVLTQDKYLNNARVNGLFDRLYLSGRDNKPENYTSSIQVSTEELYDLVPEKKMLHAMVLVAYERISGNDISMLDRYSGKPKEDNSTLNDLYWHLQELGYPMSDEEEAWLDGEHECFSYPHEEE